MSQDLTPGLYEALLTRELAQKLAKLDPQEFEAATAKLDAGDSHEAVARHLLRILQKELRGKIDKQADLYTRILATVAETASKFTDGEDLETPLEQLIGVWKRDPTGKPVELARPNTPLGANALITNAQDEPSIGTEIRHELRSADRVDLICAFVRWYGIRILEEPLRRFLDSGRPMRVITTTYMAATEARALKELAEWGAEVRVAYESKTTRLHAKAWLFHRDSGFSTGYIGSSNISRSALIDGPERRDLGRQREYRSSC